MTDAPAVPGTPKKADRNLRRFVLIGLAAAVVVGGAIGIPKLRAANRPDELTSTWAAPSVIDAGAEGDPLAMLTAVLAKAPGQLEFGGLRFDPQQDNLANFKSPGTAAEVVTGTVPAWFPTLAGSVQIASELTGELVGGAGESASSKYTATQVSLLATRRSVTAVGEDIADKLDESWDPVDEFSNAGRFTIETIDNLKGGSEYADLNIALDASPAFPGLVMVRVEAVYTDTSPLRPAPQRFQGPLAGAATVAATEGWVTGNWSVSDGIRSYGAERTDQEVIWSVADGTTASLADRLVSQLGIPDGGNVDPARAMLSYGNGSFEINTVPGLGVRWTSSSVGAAAPGPLAALKPGVAVAKVDLDAQPLAPNPQTGELTPGDAMARFEQVGLLDIEGAVAVNVESGASARSSESTSHTASQQVVVDSQLPLSEVSKRLLAALAKTGAARVEPRKSPAPPSEAQESFYVYTPRPQGMGEANYTIDVGALDGHPGLIAIRIRAEVELASAFPAPPAAAASYFAPVQKLAAPSWTLSRWFISEHADPEKNGPGLQGELEWEADVRGPAGLTATVTAVEAAAAVDLKLQGERTYKFYAPDKDDWSVLTFSDDTFVPVEIRWEGAPAAAGNAR